MTRIATKPILSDVGRQLRSGLSRALSALNEVDPAALTDWLGQADALHMPAADRALIERLLTCLAPMAHELEAVFESLEAAGEQLGLLDPHLFRAGPAAEPMTAAPMAAGLQPTAADLGRLARAA